MTAISAPQNTDPISEALSAPRTRARLPGPLLYASWFGDLGGGELRMLDHLRQTTVAADDLFVLAADVGELQRRLDGLGILHERIRWKGGVSWLSQQWTWYRAHLQCALLLRRLRPSVVVCNTWHDLETTGRVAARQGLPLIWRARADTFVSTDAWPRAKLEELVSFINGHVQRILPTTKYEADNMVAAGVSAGKVRVVHNGVDLDRYDDEASGRLLREELGIRDADFVIAFVARMVPQKGYEVLLDALARIKRSGRRFQALLVGDTTLLEGRAADYRASIHSRVDDLGLADSVRLLGARNDVHAVMNACDTFVLASHKEPFGTTVIEAMAAARPVVASDLPGPRESMLQGETGLLVPPGDAEALAVALIRLMEDKGERIGMGARGRARARELFDMHRYVRALDEECLAVAKSSCRRG